jgi:hypothetical protein
MGDKYGYMVNPGEAYQMGGNPTPKIKTWMWVAGLFVVGAGIWWFTRKTKPSIGKLTNKKAGVNKYTVTAPVTVFNYEGVGMPFGIVNCFPLPITHVEIDNNGIARLFTNDGFAGGIISKNGQYHFVLEADWNEAIMFTRQENADILSSVYPYALVGPGYLGYVTSGTHTGESVYISLNGQIGRTLNRIEDGQLMFVPLDYIDETPNIWSVYVKGG